MITLRKILQWLGLIKPKYEHINDDFNYNKRYPDPNNPVRTEWNEWGNDVWKNRVKGM